MTFSVYRALLSGALGSASPHAAVMPPKKKVRTSRDATATDVDRVPQLQRDLADWITSLYGKRVNDPTRGASDPWPVDDGGRMVTCWNVLLPAVLACSLTELTVCDLVIVVFYACCVDVAMSLSTWLPLQVGRSWTSSTGPSRTCHAC